jgi:hypothetical protein
MYYYHALHKTRARTFAENTFAMQHDTLHKFRSIYRSATDYSGHSLTRKYPCRRNKQHSHLQRQLNCTTTVLSFVAATFLPRRFAQSSCRPCTNQSWRWWRHSICDGYLLKLILLYPFLDSFPQLLATRQKATKISRRRGQHTTPQRACTRARLVAAGTRCACENLHPLCVPSLTLSSSCMT